MFEVGDVVILKSERSKDHPVRMTVTNSAGVDCWFCSWFGWDDELRSDRFTTQVLEKVD
jgi:uncharacterized protein YodC (DUF2158 family)